jgi:hypothetical protein
LPTSDGVISSTGSQKFTAAAGPLAQVSDFTVYSLDLEQELRTTDAI